MNRLNLIIAQYLFINNSDFKVYTITADFHIGEKSIFKIKKKSTYLFFDKHVNL